MITIESALHLSIIGISYLFLLLYCIRFVYRYKHEYESNKLCTCVVVFCLIVVLMTTLLLPADIFLVSYVKNIDGTFKPFATSTLETIDKLVLDSYYVFYGMITFLIVVVIPFMHFLNDSDEADMNHRFWTAIKCTIWFIIAAVLLVSVGAFIPTQVISKANSTDINPNSTNNTSGDIIINFSHLQDAVNLITTIITLAGFINVIFYTASGIVSWPISLVLGTSKVSERTSEIGERVIHLRLRITTLQEKGRTIPLTDGEKEALQKAQNELRSLEREETALNNYSESWTYRARKLLRPIQIVFGLLMGVLSALIVANLALVSVDRILNGQSSKEGYYLIHPKIFNPLEYIFTKVHNIALVGPTPMLIINCILVIATISGFRNLGLWLLLARLHKIKIRRTHPQAMLFMCITLMLTVLAYNILFFSLAPNYVTFGSQNFIKTTANGTEILPCSLEQTTKDCLRTRSSILIFGMMSQVWFFGTLFYWMTWMFVGVSFVSAIVYSLRGRRDARHGLIANEEFEE